MLLKNKIKINNNNNNNNNNIPGYQPGACTAHVVLHSSRTTQDDRIVIGSINGSAWETIFNFSLLSGSIEIVMLHLDQICTAYFGLDIKLKLFQHYGVVIVNKNYCISLKENKIKYGDTNQIRMVVSIVVSII